MPERPPARAEDLSAALAAVELAPDGPQIGAFFDYDGTVIRGFSAGAFYGHRLRKGELGPVELARTLWLARQGIHSEADFATFLELSLGAWKGRPVEELDELGRRLFKHEIAARLHLEVWELIEAHRAKGHTLALASSATPFQLQPAADALGIPFALSTPVGVRDGRLTGATDGDPLWGRGKARAVRALAGEHGIDLAASFAYSNGAEDIAFLSAVGHPTAVEPEAGLAAEAARRDWPTVRCVPRGQRPGARALARTATFYGAFGAAAAAGLGAGLLNRSRETLVEVAGGVGADLSLAMAGIRVEVVSGAEHLWGARPCLFVFNHRSKLDAIVLMKLLRSNFTGVAKAEARNVPGFGQFFQIAGVAFIDRTNISDARRAMEPAVAKLRDEGVSLVIAPEGTRSPTPRLGPFKKGPFHIAMQAGVPMVPIVLRNVDEVMWRGAQTLTPGTIEVAVLAPVDTSAWRRETIDDHVAEVRGMFLKTLAHWPRGEAAGPRSLEARA
ncbi:MAG TPA: HAD-IB family hydrolase [Solirubrobacteraceae bacterium]|nr:HAD-IB family hydrolase [Solirubrobacteraceae bacterium]